MKSLLAAALSLSALVTAPGSASFAAVAPAPPLVSYVGKYPFDKIGGYKFISHPLVSSAVERAAYNQDVRRSALSAAVASPIRRSGALLISASCEPHNCADHDWTVVVVLPRGPAAVCYHDADLMDQTSRWFIGGSSKFTSAGGCPRDAVPSRVAAYLGQGAR